MSRYIAMVVQRDGVQRYLTRGRLTDWQRNATHYPHPSNARQALAKFLSRHPTLDCATDVIDANDPERGSFA